MFGKLLDDSLLLHWDSFRLPLSTRNALQLAFSLCSSSLVSLLCFLQSQFLFLFKIVILFFPLYCSFYIKHWIKITLTTNFIVLVRPNVLYAIEHIYWGPLQLKKKKNMVRTFSNDLRRVDLKISKCTQLNKNNV